MKSYDRLLKHLYNLLLLICSVLFVIMGVSVFTNVVLRFVFSKSIAGLEELARYLLIYITFLGAALVLYDDEHLDLDIITSLLKGKLKFINRFLILFVLLVLQVLISFYGIKYAMIVIAQPTPALKIPLGTVYMILPVSTIIMSLMLISKLVHVVRLKEVS